MCQCWLDRSCKIHDLIQLHGHDHSCMVTTTLAWSRPLVHGHDHSCMVTTTLAWSRPLLHGHDHFCVHAISLSSKLIIVVYDRLHQPCLQYLSISLDHHGSSRHYVTSITHIMVKVVFTDKKFRDIQQFGKHSRYS